ncbi:chaperone NapD [Thiocystis violacea]|uniref:chaperone NapD n=1 Tax=Thiocystis violacea TaxID=13725 RepID=UPI001907CBA9|nr:chaperone NapD [Thiocystis violacea]MBK1716755.1 hypothetical protein [Thiocystis violacea]
MKREDQRPGSTRESDAEGSLETSDQAAGAPLDGDILSCVVRTRPGWGLEVAARLEGLAGVEVHGGTEVDRLVVTIEDGTGHKAVDRLGSLTLVEGVTAAVLIYHCDGRALSADPVTAEG